MDGAIQPLKAVSPRLTDHRPPPVQAKVSHAGEALGHGHTDRVRTQAKAGSLKALKAVGATLFPGYVAPTVLVSGTITIGLGALSKMPRRQSLLSAASYGASIVAGGLTYRAVKALGGSDGAGRISASAVGTAIGLGEAALLKRPTSLISLLANSFGAGYGANQAEKAMARQK
jgi:hypothetical protein